MRRIALNAFVRNNRQCLSIRRQPLSSQCSHQQDDSTNGRRWRRRRVVITGIGGITSLGPDMESTWKAVLQTRDGSKDEKYQNNGITSLYSALRQQNLSPAQFEKEWQMLQSLSCQVAASVPYEWISNHPRIQFSEEKSPAPWLDGRTARFVQLALIAAHEAISNAGLNDWLGLDKTQQTSQSNDTNDAVEDRRESFGVSIGNGMSSTRDISVASTKTLRKLSPHFVPQILPNSPAARIAIHHKLHGPNLSHSEACAAGAAAIAQAVELIQSGRVQGMVAGGCESAVESLGLGGFSKLRALSTGGSSGGTNEDTQSEGDENHAAAQSSPRPFDAQRNGFVLAEGAAMLVLEEYDHAVARGAPILAEILGVGYSGDAFHITAPEPTGKGAARAMLQAVDDAGCISMNDVDYINTHATSTPIGDVAEINAIRLALSRSKVTNEEKSPLSPLLVSSTKGATGHLLGAAGAIEAALTAVAVSKNIVPHTRNLDEISDDIAQALNSNDSSAKPERSIHLVQHEPISQSINYAISNSFGFGGTNVSLLFGKIK
ncbi:hypothetical protein ACHAXR_002413 [Thalassiosira sp. AJA248-18]